MKLRLLNTRHPTCDWQSFRRYDALYKGGEAFKKIIGQFLNQNEAESFETYGLRKKEASYRSYVGPIIDFFAAQLFSSPFLVRPKTSTGESASPDEFYSDFKEDVDMNGTDLVSFMKDRFTQSLVKKSSWWLAEMPDDEGVPAENRIDWEARGLGRVRLCLLESDQVLDWECDDYGQLQWAIVYKKEMRRDDPRLERTLTTETWKLYDQETVEVFQVTYDATKRKLKADDEIPSMGRVPHRFPRVPLVQMCLPDGLWLMNRAADAQVEHFRLSCAMSWSIKRTCYPMPVFKCKDGGKPPDVGSGLGVIIGVDEEFAWVAPKNESFSVLKEEIDVQKNEIYRISQQMAASVNNNAAALTRSGDSKQADQAATEICLHAFATHVKEAIEDTFELISDGRGDFDTKFSIEGMSSFSMDDVMTSLNNMKTALDLGLFGMSTDLKEDLAVRAADLLLPDASQDRKDSYRKQIGESAKKPPPVPVLPVPAGQKTGEKPDATGGVVPPKPNGEVPGPN